MGNIRYFKFRMIKFRKFRNGKDENGINLFLKKVGRELTERNGK